jgi:DNA-binding transcriptional ArsR family regulator
MVADIQVDRRSDLVFHALSDATRRDILRCSVAGPQSVSSLARRYPMSIAAVQKHVAVLERAGLVTKERRGREQLVRDNVAALGIARDVLDQIESAWRARMDRFAEVLAETTIEIDNQ